MPRFINKTATFAAGQSLSSVVDCSTGMPVFIYMPPDWTPAVLSFQVSPDGTNYSDLFAHDRETTVNVAAGTAIRLDRSWEPVTFLKLRSGARNSPVPQVVGHTVTIVVDTTSAVV